MPQGLFQFSPAIHSAWALGVGVALVGFTFWLAGARFNRTVATLAGVLLGGVGGIELPRLLGWSISGMGPAVAGAVVLGLIGFILHRAWVSLGLGLLLALLAGLLLWHGWGPGAGWTWPAPGAGRRQWVIDVWNQFPPEMRRLLPAVMGAALFSGLSIGILWPRPAMVLMYSLCGVCLLGGLLLVSCGGAIQHPRWLASHASGQAGVFVILVAAGAALQWRQVRRPAPAVAEEPWDDED
jgi:hypothetical protein